MPLSRRGLFSVLAGAPAAAVGMVALPAKAETIKATITLDEYARTLVWPQPVQIDATEGDWRPAR